MKTLYLLLFFAFTGLLISCTGSGKDDLYEPSELAAYMRLEEVNFKQYKALITKGKVAEVTNGAFLKIHDYEPTEDHMKDSLFHSRAEDFIVAVDKLKDSEDPLISKENYNEAVTACINCHAVSCGGPIPRIKKLYLE